MECIGNICGVFFWLDQTVAKPSMMPSSVFSAAPGSAVKVGWLLTCDTWACKNFTCAHTLLSFCSRLPSGDRSASSRGWFHLQSPVLRVATWVSILRALEVTMPTPTWNGSASFNPCAHWWWCWPPLAVWGTVCGVWQSRISESSCYCVPCWSVGGLFVNDFSAHVNYFSSPF